VNCFLLSLEKCGELLAYLGYDYYGPSVVNKPPPLISSKVVALTYVSNLVLCFSKPLFCIAGPDPDSVGFEVKERIFKGVIFFGFSFGFSFYFTLFNTASSAAPHILLFLRMQGSISGLLRLWH
jgi:hypothetical protein